MAKESRPQIAAVEVALRIRPLTNRDRAQPRFAASSESHVLRVQDNTVHVVPQAKLFNFDHVFPPQSTQGEIFSTLGDKLVRKFVEGYNVTMLAYGQTSSGKTYTMGTAQHSGTVNPEEEGIVPRAATLLFDLLQQNDTHSVSPSSSSSTSLPSFAKGSNGSRMRTPSRIRTSRSPHPPASLASPASSTKSKYSVKVSFIEIYNEELIDLLNDSPPAERPPITIREDTKGQIYWTGVREMTVQSMADVIAYLEQGTQNRATGFTDMNEKSSRSHAIFSVTLKQEKWVANSRPNSPSRSPAMARGGGVSNGRLNDLRQEEDGEWFITSSKFHFVDLAGSERLKRTAAEGDRRKEGININAGLLALGNVISVLGDPSKRGTHVPYRDSKLTRLLQDSLGGNATTLMIACVSPAESNLPETMNTLQYANRARNIKNKVEKNEVEEWMTSDNLDLLRGCIANLKAEIRALKASQDKSPSASSPASEDSLGPPLSQLDMDPLYQEQRQTIVDLKRQIEELDGEASVTRERNRIVEEQLKLHKQQASRDINMNDMDFQHLVEPVIQEYEKTISSLESQLAMARAALHHSEFGLQEQQAKIDQCEAVIEDQEQRIKELQVRQIKMAKREKGNEIYIRELEKKLENTTKNAMTDEGVLSELRGRILKFKETDESTERYITDLEHRFTAAEHAKEELRQQLAALTLELNEKQQMVDELRARLDNAGTEGKVDSETGSSTTSSVGHDVGVQVTLIEDDGPDANDTSPRHTAQERKMLCQQIARLQENVVALQYQADEREAAAEKKLQLMRLQVARIEQEKEDTLAEKDAQIEMLQNTLVHLQGELALGSKDHGHETSVRRLAITQPSSSGKRQSTDTGSLDKIDINTDSATTEPLATSNVRTGNAKSARQPTELAGTHIPSTHATYTWFDRYTHILNCYNEQIERLSMALEKTTELKTANTEPMSRKNIVLMRRVSDLEKQLAKQQVKMHAESAKFQVDMQGLYPGGNIETNDPNTTLSGEQHAALEACVTKAELDAMIARDVVNKLEAKLQKTEIALSGHPVTSLSSDTTTPDRDMEELQHRMDAMMIEPEERDRLLGDSMSSSRSHFETNLEEYLGGRESTMCS